MPVSPIAPTFYADWRSKNVHASFLGESDSPIPERFLQSVWHHQRILREKLKTLDGKRLRILHPGFWNHEAGPDFQGAVIQLDDEPAKSGDIEIDLRSDGWRAHGHDRNPNFSNVVLHVIWELEKVGTSECRVTRPNASARPSAPATSSIETLVLKPFLDSPIPELTAWIGSEPKKGWPADLAGQCCAPLREFSEAKLMELLQQAAFVRMQRKAEQFQARARQAGWEQALWEGIFRALGYKQNVWPMQRLAELLPNCDGEKSPARAWQARLLGMSNLLPTQPEEMESDAYVRSIWDIWWRERHSELVLPKSLWRFNGMRPANFPQRRLALASHWLANKNFFPKLEKWFTTQNATASPAQTLLEFLQVEEDEFWSWHWTFRSARLPMPQALIGASRVTDLAINVILPWFWMRAVIGKNDDLKERAEQIYFKWPAADDNSTLRLARQRLLGGLASRPLPTAAAQQGLLQVVKDFCEHSNAICSDCRFPELVRSWNLQA